MDTKHFESFAEQPNKLPIFVISPTTLLHISPHYSVVQYFVVIKILYALHRREEEEGGKCWGILRFIWNRWWFATSPNREYVYTSTTYYMCTCRVSSCTWRWLEKVCASVIGKEIEEVSYVIGNEYETGWVVLLSCAVVLTFLYQFDATCEEDSWKGGGLL